MVIGPCARRPILGSTESFTGSRSRRPILLTKTRSLCSRQITAEQRLTPSFNFTTLVARPERSRTSARGSRLKRPSLLSSPRLSSVPSPTGSSTMAINGSPSRPLGRNFSRDPGCCPANSQRTKATRPLALTPRSRGDGSIGRMTCAGEGWSPTAQGSDRCMRPSTGGLITFTCPSAWMSNRASAGKASRAC